MPDERETKGRNRWRTARERDRMRARHEIRMRVKSAFVDVDSHLEECSRNSGNFCNDGQPLCDLLQPSTSLPLEHPTLSDNQVAIARHFVRDIALGKKCSFSVTALSEHFALLNQPIPVTLLSAYKIKTLCTSRFGADYAQKIQSFVDARHTCSLFEYASLLGEYRMLGPMLAGGLDPTLRGKMKSDVVCNFESDAQRRRRILSVRILKRFFDSFPTSLSSYIVKRVMDMRLEYWENSSCDSHVCTLCGTRDDPAQLSFGWPCHDLFCENCFWESMLNSIDDRDDGDVVLCPVCGVSGSKCKENPPSVADSDSPSERGRKSLTRYLLLPETIDDLKKLPKRNKVRHRVLCSSWSEAVSASVGSSKNVRKDKFFVSTEGNAYHYVRGCLVAGMDVNSTNEYGQTCLFIASWRGYTKLVKLLLEFGADPAIEANGGDNAESVSRSHGHENVLKLLEQCPKGRPNSNLRNFVFSKPSQKKAITVLKTLINLERDHVGAGSYLIDSAFSSPCIDTMTRLWRSLPVEPSEERKSSKICSRRSYYCDASGSLCDLMKSVISNAFQSHVPPLRDCFVFPHMRVLHYAHPGSILAPHQDLSRTDVHGNCSTHTFIVYLVDCEDGGETSLLDALSGDGRRETLARVSPVKGRLLLFPHACPHEGNEVTDVPKVLFRGEVKLTWLMTS